MRQLYEGKERVLPEEISRTPPQQGDGVKLAVRSQQKPFVRGWVNYFAASTMAKFVRRTDEWLRRRIRQIYWKQWKKVRTKFAALRKLGADDRVAWEWANTRKSYWHTANSWILSTSLTNDRLRNLGWTCLGDVYK